MMKRTISEIEWLEKWYQSQCDGAWEHEFCIRGGTLDNPGWWLEVDLQHTGHDGLSVPRKLVERSEHDWIDFKIEEGRFYGYGGPRNLGDIIEVFAALVEGRPLPWAWVEGQGSEENPSREVLSPGAGPEGALQVPAASAVGIASSAPAIGPTLRTGKEGSDRASQPSAEGAARGNQASSTGEDSKTYMMKRMISGIDWLEKWYHSHCDGDWEHDFRVRLGSLDNPGWRLKVNLEYTAHDGLTVPGNLVERSEHDWIRYKVERSVFYGEGGPGNLRDLIEVFAALMEGRPIPWA